MIPSLGRIYIQYLRYIPARMAKHLIDLDEEKLSAARAELGTKTIKETVNKALGLAGSQRHDRTVQALDVLAQAPLDDRENAWR